MRNDLMAEEVEVDPFVRGTALPASQNLAVESARLGKVAHGKSKVKTGSGWHSGFVMFACERSRLCG